jgi:hypothetical protein
MPRYVDVAVGCLARWLVVAQYLSEIHVVDNLI